MWEEKHAALWIVKVLREGYNFEFAFLPKLLRSPSVLTEGSRTKEDVLTQQFQTSLDKGAWEVYG